MVEGAEVGGLELGVGVELAGVWVDGEWPRAGGRKTSEVQKWTDEQNLWENTDPEMRFKEAQQRQSLIFEEEEFECHFCGNFFTKTNTEHQPKSPPTTQVAQPEQKYLQLENILKCYHRPARITQFVTDGLAEHNNKMFSVFRFNLS